MLQKWIRTGRKRLRHLISFVSISDLERRGYAITFQKGRCHVTKDHKLCMTAYNIEGVYAVQHCTGNNDCFDESENNDFYYESDFKVHEVNFAKSCKPDNRERSFIQQSHVAEKVFWNKDFKKQCFNNKNDGLCLKDYNTRELCDMNEQNGFYSVDEFSDCDNDDFESREMSDDDEWDFENEDCNSENCEDDFESETEFDYASDYQFMPSEGGGTP
uniref:Uncharacterized protein n=1 Tax=Sphaerodactylus townsendi TaxID=933632 RepID=A0ACB8F9D5_9SAUR